MIKKIFFTCFLIIWGSTYSQELSATGFVYNILCAGSNSGEINIVAEGGQSPYSFSLNGGSWIQSNQSSYFFYNLSAGNHVVQVRDNNNFTVSLSLTINAPSSPLNLFTTAVNDVVTFYATGGTPPYMYTLDGMQYFSTNVITGVQPGNYNPMVQDSFGCMLVDLVTVLPSVPLINNSTQVFAQGSTLADIQVTGQNIKWYATQTGYKTSSSELPLSTVLVNGATYYVSQTVNGVESNKVGITTQVGSLSANEFDFQKLEVYPIPVKDVISIKNISKIKKATFFNYLGAELFSKNVNEEIFSIDLTALNKGVYFLKLESENSEKIVKFVKE